MDLVRRYARASEPELVFAPERKRSPLALRRRVTYYGFDLGHEIEAIDEFPPELRDRARHLIAEGLARGEARHVAVKRNQPLIDEIRETWRRSGGKTPKLGFQELRAMYEARLAGVSSYSDFRRTDLDLTQELQSLVPADLRAEYAQLPGHVFVRDREVDVQYDVEESERGPIGIARLRLPEKLARTLAESELPTFDRPLRFVVTRGARGAARASTLAALQEELERPFTEDELEAMNRAWEAKREDRRERKRRERAARGVGEGRSGHRRKQRPGRRERAAQRQEGDGSSTSEAAQQNDRRRGPRPPYVEREGTDQRGPRRRGGVRGRRGPRWR
jgi:hypothetical protein